MFQQARQEHFDLSHLEDGDSWHLEYHIHHGKSSTTRIPVLTSMWLVVPKDPNIYIELGMGGGSILQGSIEFLLTYAPSLGFINQKEQIVKRDDVLINLLMPFSHGLPIFIMAHHKMTLKLSSWKGVSILLEGKTFHPFYHRLIWKRVISHNNFFAPFWKRWCRSESVRRISDQEPDWMLRIYDYEPKHAPGKVMLQLELSDNKIDEIDTIEVIFEKTKGNHPRTAIHPASKLYDVDTRSIWIPCDHQTQMMIRFTCKRLLDEPLFVQAYFWMQQMWSVGEFTCFPCFPC